MLQFMFHHPSGNRGGPSGNRGGPSGNPAPQRIRPGGKSGPACSDGEYLIKEVPHSFLGGHAGWQGREGMLARASGLVGAGRQRRRLVEFRKPCKNTASIRVNAKSL